MDYYKITVSRRTGFRYGITSTDGYTLTFAYKEGEVSNFSKYNKVEGLYDFMPGTYYFRVSSPQGKYSASSTYSVKFTKIEVLSSNSVADVIYVCEAGKNLFQTNLANTVYYVNGNSIDVNYSYYEHLPLSVGIQEYDIRIDQNKIDSIRCVGALYYMRSTRPAMTVSERPVLELTFEGANCYTIHCNCMGAYAANTCNEDLSWVTVFIDPETGKLIDILELSK